MAGVDHKDLGAVSLITQCIACNALQELNPCSNFTQETQ